MGSDFNATAAAMVIAVVAATGYEATIAAVVNVVGVDAISVEVEVGVGVEIAVIGRVVAVEIVTAVVIVVDFWLYAFSTVSVVEVEMKERRKEGKKE